MMNYKYIHIVKNMLLAGILILVLQACQKEFMPDPVGQAIAAPEYPALLKALDGSPYTLFKAAWNRSSMNKLIADSLPQAKLTFFVPTDAAMQQAGYTLDKINSASVNELNTLLCYHVLNSQISHAQLATATSPQVFNSLLKSPKFFEVYKNSYNSEKMVPYTYQHTLTASPDGLTDNGETIKTGTEIPVSGGRIIPVEKVLKEPGKQMIDVLRNDARFSLFVKALEINAAMYEQYVVANFIFSINFAPYKYRTDQYALMEGGSFSKAFVPIVSRFTLFAPTDEAFNHLGIYTADDIRLLNNRSPLGDYWDGTGCTPSDSLLLNQKIDISRAAADLDWDLFLITNLLVTREPNMGNTVFYGASLNNQMLGNYPLRSLLTDNGWQNEYLNLDFGKDAAGHITIKQKASTAEPAIVIEENINTLQGPIHVINRMIIPNGFKMWHK